MRQILTGIEWSAFKLSLHFTRRFKVCVIIKALMLNLEAGLFRVTSFRGTVRIPSVLTWPEW